MKEFHIFLRVARAVRLESGPYFLEPLVLAAICPCALRQSTAALGRISSIFCVKSGLGSPCISHLEIWNYFYEQYLAADETSRTCVSLRCFWKNFTYFHRVGCPGFPAQFALENLDIIFTMVCTIQVGTVSRPWQENTQPITSLTHVTLELKLLQFKLRGNGRSEKWQTYHSLAVDIDIFDRAATGAPEKSIEFLYHCARQCLARNDRENMRASLTNVSAVAPVRPGENAVAQEVLVPAGGHLRLGGVLIASGRARVGGTL